MKKVFKIAIFLLVILFLYSATYSIYASGNIKDIWDVGNKFLDTGEKATFAERIDRWVSAYTAKNMMLQVIDFLWGIGLLVIFICTVVLGIKYMMVLPNEKSRLKQATTPYIIGVVCVFGALTIWKFLINLFEGSMLGK